MRFIIVGDPHVRVQDLGDAQALLDYVRQLAREYRAKILILGDLYHHHGIIHSEVMHLWHLFCQQTEQDRTEVIMLVGNHDRPGVTGSSTHSLLAHEVWQHVSVVSGPSSFNGGVLLVPYCSNEELVAAAQNFGRGGTIICHATFNGSKYENGMYAKDGVDPELLPQKQIISGHIHAPQEFGKVWHPGAPRALTVSDANVRRAVWLVEFERDAMQNRTPFYLDDVCRQLYHFEDTPAQPLSIEFNPKHKYAVDITGPSSWIAERKPLYQGKAQVRTFRTDKPLVKLKESEGVSIAFGKYLSAYQPQYGTDRAVLEQMLKERGVHV